MECWISIKWHRLFKSLKICFRVFLYTRTQALYFAIQFEVFQIATFSRAATGLVKKKKKRKKYRKQRTVYSRMYNSKRALMRPIYYTRVLYVEDELTHVENGARSWCMSSNMTIRSYERCDARVTVA